MKYTLIDMLENNSIEIAFKSRIPYLCNGTTEDYGVISTLSLGDKCLTGYNGICKETVSQDIMDEIKTSIINILKK